MKLYIFIQQNNHTLVSTQTTDGDKTITGCQVGQPIILGHKSVANKSTGCWYKVKSGCAFGTVGYHNYFMGLQDADVSSTTLKNIDGPVSAVLIASATTVVVTLWALSDDGDSVLIYR